MLLRAVTIFSVLEMMTWSVEAQDTRQQVRRRCYTCRSRGDRGDCRDPFIPPEYPEGALRRQSVDIAVAETECSTGWCSKTMEGLDKNFGDNDYGIATERQCMERAPSDDQERCAFVQIGHKEVYMCFCKGDLCNSGHSSSPAMLILLLTLAALFLHHQ